MSQADAGPGWQASMVQPLTERDGVPLREDVRDYGALHGDRPVTWRESIHRWRDYIEEKDDVSTVFQNDDGDTCSADQTHRFAPDYADQQYAKLKDLERGISDEYGKRLHTAMLTFTASSEPDDEPLPPVDHFADLDASWDAVTTALDRALEGRRYERLAILDMHQSGYLHIHMGVFVDGVVSRETFAPVIESHVRNCPIAEWDGHDLEDDRTISVRHAGRDRADESDEHLDELAIYLAEYLGAYGEDPLDQPDHVQAANAVLWATGKQRWRPSNGAQSYMASEVEDDETEWDLLGIEQDGELVEVDPENGGVDRFVTSSLPPPDDPAQSPARAD
jgi:hypothetical protein